MAFIPRYKKITLSDDKARISIENLNSWIKKHVHKGARNVSIQLMEKFDSRFSAFAVVLEAYWEEKEK